MSHQATDCFAAAAGLQYTWFRTDSPDVNDAVLVSIDDWIDAGSKELYVPLDMGPSRLGPFATILGASVDDRFRVLLQSVFK